MSRPLPARERVRLEREALDAVRAGEPVAHIARRLRLGRATIYRWIAATPGLRRSTERTTTCPTCGAVVREPAAAP